MSASDFPSFKIATRDQLQYLKKSILLSTPIRSSASSRNHSNIQLLKANKSLQKEKDVIVQESIPTEGSPTHSALDTLSAFSSEIPPLTVKHSVPIDIRNDENGILSFSNKIISEPASTVEVKPVAVPPTVFADSPDVVSIPTKQSSTVASTVASTSFSFGAPTTLAPPVKSDFSKVNHTHDPILIAAEYVCLLGLSGDDEADIEDEIKVALEAWTQAAGDVASVDVTEVAAALTRAEREASLAAGDQDEDMYALLNAEDSVLSRLVEALGTTYSAGEHGKRLVEAARDGQLHREAFVRWYLSYVFVGDGDEEGGGVDEEEEEEDDDRSMGELPSLAVPAVEAKPAANTEKPAVSADGWAGVSWTVRPTETATIAGKSWRCEQCMVSNAWSAPECTACGSSAPSEAAGSSVGVNGATKPSGSIGTGGFVFGGNSSSSGVSSGFGFGAPATAPAPSTGFGFGASAATPAPPTGFGFGASAATPTPTTSNRTHGNTHLSHTNKHIITHHLSPPHL